jgi:cyclophilin family peptidyl-prolyl cis-trans isomerase
MKTTIKKFLAVAVGVAAISFAIGCGDSKDPSATKTDAPVASSTPSTSDAPKADSTAPTGGASTPEPAPAAPAAEDKLAPEDMPKPGEKVAVIETNLGEIVFKFLPSKAPNHVKNFEKLADSKFYDGTKFHRVIPGFMIQGGDPNTKPGATGMPGTGNPGWTVKAEFNDTPHVRGVVSMARSQDPDSAGSQFFICVDKAPFLDHQYSAFGKVVKGMDVVDKIVALPRDERDMPTPKEAVMKTVRIKTWPLK